VDLVINGDVSVEMHENEAFSVLLNDGVGGFLHQKGQKDPQSNVQYMSDLDGDGDLEVLTRSLIDDRMFVLYWKDDGFGPPSPFLPEEPGKGTVLWGGDLDGDGDLDLITAGFEVSQLPPECYVSVLLNDGYGTFRQAGSVPLGRVMPVGVCGSDWDGDGDVDLAMLVWVTSQNPLRVLPLLNDGEGHLRPEGECVPVEKPPCMWGIGDVDLDGDVDVLYAQKVEGGYHVVEISVWYNEGDWRFSQVVVCSTMMSGWALSGVGRSLQWEDFDADGDVDIAWLDARDLCMYVWLNNGDRTFSEGGRYDLSGEPSGIFLGDLDGDGDVDVAVSDLSSNAVCMLFNRTVEDVTGVIETGRGTEVVPQRCILYGNVPNPFNAFTTIPFDLSFSGRVRLGVYDVLGRKVKTLLDDEREAGSWTVRWDGRDDAGYPAASGRYVYRFRAGTFSDSKTMTLIR